MTSEVILEEDFVERDYRIYNKITKVEKSSEFPEGLKYTFNFMVFRDGKWQNIARVDNSLHMGQVAKMHLHRMDKETAEHIDIPLEKIKDYIIKIGMEVEKWLK